MTTLTNTFAGGTAGNAITAGNSGGLSGNAFDMVNTGSGATLTYDGSMGSGQGPLACALTTGGTAAAASCVWSTSMGTQTTIYFREYLYFPSLPSASLFVFQCLSAGTQCAVVRVGATGQLAVQDATGATLYQSPFVTPVPAGRWFRLEGFVTGSATVGQVSLSAYLGYQAAWDTVQSNVQPTVTFTSSATQNTTGSPDIYRFGMSQAQANVSYWLSGLGLSSTGPPGPVPPAVDGMVRGYA